MGTGVFGLILVVDDERPVLDFVAMNLRSGGYEVAIASSGEEAVRMVEQQKTKPHLLVAALVLPGISGLALADTLRRENPAMKTLFISGYTGAEYFRQMKVSATDIPFLQKPFTVDALLNKVQELLATKTTPGK